ncbi:MAG: LPXTG cell wall anchor domain-containing protein [Eubacteriales bacterium]|nr:LPXTG cell wall anchor domain-containing protein [Eubacteriales bacterium]MDD4475439.1 LPXTG cell wall anchor domain-containing protein [Eubacteriales bacterium]
MKKVLSVMFALMLIVAMTATVTAEDAKLAIAEVTYVAVEADAGMAPQGGGDISVLTDGDALTAPTAFSTKGIVLFQNKKSTEAGVYTEFSLVIELEESSVVGSVVLDFYKEYNSMIGLPQNNEVAIAKSSDGTAFIDVETLTFEGEAAPAVIEMQNVKLDLTEAVEAKFIKLTFTYGDSPFADATPSKPVWEWMGLTEVGVLEGVMSEVSEDVSEDTSETPATGDNGYVALAVIAVVSLAGAAIISRKKRA